MSKTIKLNDINIYSVLIEPNKKVITMVYALVDDQGNEWHRKRVEIKKDDLTTAQLQNVVKSVQVMKLIIKSQEKI